MMKYYEQLLKTGCFTWEEICLLVGNQNTANALVQSYLKKGYIRRVKQNLYVAVNLLDDEPAVSKYRIATKITDSAYVSHHAAFDYYGYANQVSYQVEVSSKTEFRPFNFEDITYRYLKSRIAEGVTVRPDGVRVTDPERTLLDNINDFDKVMGIEELLRCIALIPTLKEDKLLQYLALYDKQFLYQKTGYILSDFQSDLNLSDDFFNKCTSHIGNSKRYLFRNSNDGIYDSKWRIIAPRDLSQIVLKGDYADATI
ncbi:MAG: transcriptional regulator [Clostridiales Family XIII bacterium]|jgi:predicted transcriptional regulator of viral defense system|nr:transcriptional regulator [Clostridiales Family XIII bacterium]